MRRRVSSLFAWVTSSSAAGFTLPDSVRVLADKVVDGNAANAHFQGAALGNLHAGSSATQLQDLVAKWFYGGDHPLAAAGTTYRMVSGSLFVNGPSYGDAVQGQVGYCYFVAALAGDEMAIDSVRAQVGDVSEADPDYRPVEAEHLVMDADASQSYVVNAALAGRNLVVQGPPGTGKSQTITNIIAGAVHSGKRVLFIAEKMAALEVVHDRLVAKKLAPICLELHSRKSSKRQVLDQIQQGRNAAAPPGWSPSIRRPTLS